MACINKNLYQSQEWCKGQPIIPGIRTRIYFCPKGDIVKYPARRSGAATAKEDVTYDGDFTLAAEKTWKFMDVISKKSPVTSESQGEQPNISTLVKATFVHPGFEEEATAFCKQANSDDLIYLIQQRNGKWRVIGSEEFETVTKCSQSIGGDVTDEAGTTVEIEVTDYSPAPFYTGKILTEEGTIDAGTGDVTVDPKE